MNQWLDDNTVKPVLSGHSKKDQILAFKTDYCLMQVKSIAEGSILQYFRPSLSYHLSLRSLSIFEWPFYTGFTVYGPAHHIMVHHLGEQRRLK